MAQPYSTESLIKALRKLATAYFAHGTACDLNESSNRLQDHAEAFKRLAECFDLDPDDFHGVTKTAIGVLDGQFHDLNNTEFVLLSAWAKLGLPKISSPDDYKSVEDLARKVGEQALTYLRELDAARGIAPGSDLSIGTLCTLLGSQLRNLKGRREFSLAATKLQEVEMW